MAALARRTSFRQRSKCDATFSQHLKNRHSAQSPNDPPGPGMLAIPRCIIESVSAMAARYERVASGRPAAPASRDVPHRADSHPLHCANGPGVGMYQPSHAHHRRPSSDRTCDIPTTYRLHRSLRPILAIPICGEMSACHHSQSNVPSMQFSPGHSATNSTSVCARAADTVPHRDTNARHQPSGP